MNLSVEQIQQERTLATIIVQRDALLEALLQRLEAVENENKALKEAKQAAEKREQEEIQKGEIVDPEENGTSQGKDNCRGLKK